MAIKPNNFLKYLEDNHYDQLHRTLLYYIKKNKEHLIVDRYNLIGAENIEIEDLCLSSVFIDSKDGVEIVFDVQANPEISYTEISGKHRTREASGTNRLWFTIPCKAKVTDKLSGFYCFQPEEYNPSKPRKPLSGNLVPVIYHNQYDDYATEILKEKYPEALQGTGHIDAMVLAEKLGFKVIKRRIAKDKSIFGQIYLENCRVKLYNDSLEAYEEVYIPADTIVIDSSTNKDYSYGCENITIAHECVHGYLHKKAFNFARLYNKRLTGIISCTTNGEIRHINPDDDSSYMESQANGIAPCLLLPKQKLLNAYYDELEAFMCMGFNRLEATQEVIFALADKFHVTNYAIKKRLIDLGKDEVAGVYNWVDDDWVRPFSFKKGSLGPNETFTIKTDDFLDMIHNNKMNLLMKLYHGQYVFVENHLVINDEKYVERSNSGNLILTEYARFHMDECCLKFKCKSRAIKNNDVMMFCYLARGTNIDLSMDMELSDPNINLADPDVQLRFDSYNTLMQEVLKTIRGMEFCEAISYIMEVQDLQIQDITDDPHDMSSISYRQFERYKNGETKKLTKGVVIAICLALKLPPVVTQEILKIAGITLTNSKEDSMLLIIISTGRGKKFDDLNKMLTDRGFAPLTKRREKS